MRATHWAFAASIMEAVPSLSCMDGETFGPETLLGKRLGRKHGMELLLTDTSQHPRIRDLVEPKECLFPGNPVYLVRVIRSQKPRSGVFKRWLTDRVIPSILKTKRHRSGCSDLQPGSRQSPNLSAF